MNIDSNIVHSASTVRWHGAVEGIHQRLLYGWAFDSARPDARVVVEVCLDDHPVACVAADCARADLAGQLEALGAADLCHGFVADLEGLSFDAGGTLSARVANSAAMLAPADSPASATRSRSTG